MDIDPVGSVAPAIDATDSSGIITAKTGRSNVRVYRKELSMVVVISCGVE